MTGVSRARRDRSFTGGGGLPTPTRVTVDLGDTPVPSQTVTVEDPRITVDSSINAWTPIVATASRDADDVGMDPLLVRSQPGNGRVAFTVTGLDGPIYGPYTIDYLILG